MDSVLGEDNNFKTNESRDNIFSKIKAFEDFEHLKDDLLSGRKYIPWVACSEEERLKEIKKLEEKKLIKFIGHDLIRKMIIPIKMRSDPSPENKLRKKKKAKKRGIVSLEDERQPSKGKIYGRKFDGRFASKATFKYHSKKKRFGLLAQVKPLKSEYKTELLKNQPQSDTENSCSKIMLDESAVSDALKALVSFGTPSSSTLHSSSLKISSNDNKRLMIRMDKSFVLKALEPLKEKGTQKEIKPSSSQTSSTSVSEEDPRDDLPNNPSLRLPDKHPQYDSDSSPYLPLPNFSIDGCLKDYCRFGCICQSIRVLPRNIKKNHCGRVQCMLSCHCQHLTRARASVFEALSPILDGKFSVISGPQSPRMKLFTNNYSNFYGYSEDELGEETVKVKGKKKIKRKIEAGEGEVEIKKKSATEETTSKIKTFKTNVSQKVKKSRESSKENQGPDPPQAGDCLEISSESENETSKPIQKSSSCQLKTQNSGDETNKRKTACFLVKRKQMVGEVEVEQALLMETISSCDWQEHKNPLTGLLFDLVFNRDELKSGKSSFLWKNFFIDLFPGQNKTSIIPEAIKQKVNLSSLKHVKICIKLHKSKQAEPLIIVPDSPSEEDKKQKKSLCLSDENEVNKTNYDAVHRRNLSENLTEKNLKQKTVSSCNNDVLAANLYQVNKKQKSIDLIIEKNEAKKEDFSRITKENIKKKGLVEVISNGSNQPSKPNLRPLSLSPSDLISAPKLVDGLHSPSSLDGQGKFENKLTKKTVFLQKNSSLPLKGNSHSGLKFPPSLLHLSKNSISTSQSSDHNNHYSNDSLCKNSIRIPIVQNNSSYSNLVNIQPKKPITTPSYSISLSSSDHSIDQCIEIVDSEDEEVSKLPTPAQTPTKFSEEETNLLEKRMPPVRNLTVSQSSRLIT